MIMNSRGLLWRTRAIALVLILCLAAPQLLESRVKPSSGSDFFSRDQEIQAGQQAAADANKKLPILPDSSPITQYVQRLGQKLASHAPGDKWPYSFHVVNQKDVNAFALPGGPVYVNLGTIQAADNEAQLAGVMAHEISHIVQRHATRAATKQMEAQVPLSILGSILGGGLGGQLAQLGISFGVGSYFLKNSRKAESEADLVGTDIMYDTGYDPHQMAAFFQKLEKEGGARGPQFLSDHPNPGNRVQAVSKEVTTLPPKPFISDSPEFQSVKRTAMGMKPLTAQQIAEQQKQGGATGGGGTVGNVSGADIAPSSNFRALDHNAFQISYPENWQVAGDASSAVTIAPRAGVSQGTIAYGVIISGYQPESPNTSLDDATHQLIATIRQSNPDLRTVGHDENIRVNGVSGKSVDLIGPSPMQTQGGGAVRERDWLVTLPRADGTLLYLVFISPDSDFGQLRPAYEKMLKSLRLK